MLHHRVTRLRAGVAAASLLGAVIVSGALANDRPVTVPSTGEEPIGTPGTVTLPTPIWETTVEPEPTTLVEVVELPSTGAGSTAR